MTSHYGLYAYGLVGAMPGQLHLPGIDKKNNVYAVKGRGLRVVVSAIEIEAFQSQVKQSFSELTQSAGGSQNATEALLQAHEDVVDALMQQTSVVPFKFGTILKDEEAASKMLRDEEERFKQLLAKFAGKAEWGLKVYADTGEFTQHVAQTDPSFKDLQAQREKLSRGAAYLLGKKLEEALKDTVAAQLASVTGAIFQQLGKDAYEATLNKTLPQKLTGKKKEMILNSAYLVEKAGTARFRRHGKSLQEQYASMGLDLDVSGPWPPYSFT
jgi:Gas vesicle synthesis protein GvpL/GvpF